AERAVRVGAADFTTLIVAGKDSRSVRRVDILFGKPAMIFVDLRQIAVTKRNGCAVVATRSLDDTVVPLCRVLHDRRVRRKVDAGELSAALCTPIGILEALLFGRTESGGSIPIESTWIWKR